ncbi:MAG TPA: hypothetical protein VGN97_00845 [Mesorhizobium sp.]|jgi:Mg2+ and Co2+ transporter CorA|nr:hypothetical protein [Mesorhizobium sp.]
MAEVTNELTYEVLRKMQADMSLMKDSIGEIRQELVSIRLGMLSMQNDIYGIFGRHDERLERIERRLELRELAEAQRPFEHEP